MTVLRAADLLDHIRQAAMDARSFVEGSDRAAFRSDRRTQQAVIMSLVIIGEAATKLMDRHPDLVARHPAIPWRSMRGMRNRIAHGYFEVDLDVVWETVQTALPELLEKLSEFGAE